MYVEVVGAGEPNAELSGPQRAEVASLLGVDIADVGNGQTHLVGSVACPIIRGLLEIVHQAEGGGELVAAVDAHPCWVDANGGHVAAYCTHGVAHTQGFGCALIEGLGKDASVGSALRECNYDG